MQFVHKPTIMGGHGGRIPIVYDADNDVTYYGDNGGNHTDIMWGAFGAKGYLDKKLMHMDLSFLAYQEASGSVKVINGSVSPSKMNEITSWCNQNLHFENYSHVADVNSTLLSPEAAKFNTMNGLGQAFGYVDGQLYFGTNHSKITTAMVLKGWDYQKLYEAPQLWGWLSSRQGNLKISFGTDDKWLENYNFKSLEQQAKNAINLWWVNTRIAQRGARNWT